jgi:hypothetical protein
MGKPQEEHVGHGGSLDNRLLFIKVNLARLVSRRNQRVFGMVAHGDAKAVLAGLTSDGWIV